MRCRSRRSTGATSCARTLGASRGARSSPVTCRSACPAFCRAPARLCPFDRRIRPRSRLCRPFRVRRSLCRWLSMLRCRSRRRSSVPACAAFRALSLLSLVAPSEWMVRRSGGAACGLRSIWSSANRHRCVQLGGLVTSAGRPFGLRQNHNPARCRGSVRPARGGSCRRPRLYHRAGYRLAADDRRCGYVFQTTGVRIFDVRSNLCRASVAPTCAWDRSKK